MSLSAWIFGGVHDDPGSRHRFLEELTQHPTAPHFVAVEWEHSLFRQLALLRPSIEVGLSSRPNFLTSEDRHELSLALAWEGDAHARLFPGTHVVWLENGFQQAVLQQRGSDPNQFAESSAHFLLQRLSTALQHSSSRSDLVDAVSKGMWAEASAAAHNPADFERDVRWATTICECSSKLSDGWIAIVVGWAHADPTTADQRLPHLLSARGFGIESVRLGPVDPGHAHVAESNVTVSRAAPTLARWASE